MTCKKVVFIGGGQMARALASGAVMAGVLNPADLVFVEPDADQVDCIKSEFPESACFSHSQKPLTDCDYVVLCVKPNVLRAIAPQLATLLEPRHLVLSIAAGISLETLQDLLKTPRVIRVMPNTPAQLRAGASAIASDASAAAADVQWVEKLMSAVGLVVHVPDGLMHAVTGLSGSGPAYIFMVIEALSDGGVAAGLSRDVATRLAAQTVLGAARMVLESGKHPGALKDQVTSPGGTTIAAIRELEAAGIRSAFIEAVLASAQRSQELS